MRTINTQVQRAGLKYVGGINECYIQLSGISLDVKIPLDRLDEFVELFPELNWKVGCFIQDIVGKYIRVTFDEDFNVYSLHHIIKNIDYMF